MKGRGHPDGGEGAAATVYTPRECLDCGIPVEGRRRVCTVCRHRRRGLTYLKQAALVLAPVDAAAHGAVEVLIGRLEVRR